MRGRSILSVYKKRMTGREVGVCKFVQKRGMTMRGRSILSAYKKRMTERKERL